MRCHVSLLSLRRRLPHEEKVGRGGVKAEQDGFLGGGGKGSRATPVTEVTTFFLGGSFVDDEGGKSRFSFSRRITFP